MNKLNQWGRVVYVNMLQLVALLFAGIIFAGCWSRCDDPVPYDNDSLILILRDKATGIELVSEDGIAGTIHADSVRIVDENNEQLNLGGGTYGVPEHEIGPFRYVSSVPQSGNYNRVLYLKLGSADTDTISINYTLYRNGCDALSFKDVEVHFNSKLVLPRTQKSGNTITIYK